MPLYWGFRQGAYEYDPIQLRIVREKLSEPSTWWPESLLVPRLRRIPAKGVDQTPSTSKNKEVCKTLQVSSERRCHRGPLARCAGQLGRLRARAPGPADLPSRRKPGEGFADISDPKALEATIRSCWRQQHSRALVTGAACHRQFYGLTEVTCRRPQRSSCDGPMPRMQFDWASIRPPRPPLVAED